MAGEGNPPRGLELFPDGTVRDSARSDISEQPVEFDKKLVMTTKAMKYALASLAMTLGLTAAQAQTSTATAPQAPVPQLSPTEQWIKDVKNPAGDGRGLGIHGSKDPSSIGKSVSAGCVRMHNADVEELYGLLPVGTPVTVVD